MFEHVAPACGNLCRALGEDFAMFLPVVLPPLLTALEAEVKFNMETADPDEDGEVRLLAPAAATSRFVSFLPGKFYMCFVDDSSNGNVHRQYAECTRS